jgi:hypothetical protein
VVGERVLEDGTHAGIVEMLEDIRAFVAQNSGVRVVPTDAPDLGLMGFSAYYVDESDEEQSVWYNISINSHVEPELTTEKEKEDWGKFMKLFANPMGRLQIAKALENDEDLI